MSKQPRPETLLKLFRHYGTATVANAVGVSTETITDWVAGRQPIYYTYIEPLARILRIGRDRVIDACFQTSGSYPIGP